MKENRINNFGFNFFKVFLLIILKICSIYSQDTSIVNFLPLKIGNVWVYDNNNSGSHHLYRMKAVDTVVANNHKFYTMSREIIGSLCNYGPVCDINPLRVDSIRGYVLANHSGAEFRIDSLRSIFGSSFPNDCSGFFLNCTESSSNSKTFYYSMPHYEELRSYSRGLGVIHERYINYVNTCEYTLVGACINGVLWGDTTFSTLGVNTIPEVPTTTSLNQNYPNPFNPQTMISFEVSKKEFYKLTVFDQLGQQIAVLLNKELSTGRYEANWDATSFASGVYYFELVSEDFRDIKKMVLLK